MPLTASDLLDPVGEIVASLFPSDSSIALTNRLDAYLSEGYDEAADVADVDARDAAAKHWAYARAYKAVFIRLSGAKSSLGVDGAISVAFTSAQIANFEKLANENQAAFDAIVASGEESPAAPTVPAASMSTPLVTTW